MFKKSLLLASALAGSLVWSVAAQAVPHDISHDATTPLCRYCAVTPYENYNADTPQFEDDYPYAGGVQHTGHVDQGHRGDHHGGGGGDHHGSGGGGDHHGGSGGGHGGGRH